MSVLPKLPIQEGATSIVEGRCDLMEVNKVERPLAAASSDWPNELIDDKRQAPVKLRVPASVHVWTVTHVQNPRYSTTPYRYSITPPCHGRDGSPPPEHGLPLLPIPDTRDHATAHTT
jgi:hypothetical protein